jgi:hypothetical protein
MISSYSLLVTALVVIASRTTPVTSSFVSNQLIGDHIVKRTLEEGNDPFLMMSAKCKSEGLSLKTEIKRQQLDNVAGNKFYICEDAGGKIFEVEYEGTCPYSSEGFSTEYSARSDFSNWSNWCVGTSCTTKNFQASFNAMVTESQSSYRGCSNFKVSSGAFSLGTAGCVMAGLLLSTVALFN